MTSAEALEASYRADWGRLLALLLARSRRLDLVEDALADAFARAAARWPTDGVPGNPAAWLFTVAQRRILDVLRAEAVAARKAPLLVVRPGSASADGAGWASGVGLGSADGADESLPDDRLDLIVLCCHPALPLESRSAIALRLVMGATTEQIARLFLVPTPTMAARLTRAKRKIVDAGIPLGAPVDAELRTRLDDVCRTVYLAFTAGYAPGSGPDLLRVDVAGDAVRLAAILHDLVPRAPQVSALLALLMLQHSRREARELDGNLVTLGEQDRGLWRHDEIRVGLGLLAGLPPRSATAGAGGDAYALELGLQALIAAEHARAPTSEQTDWPRIARHYADLEELTGSPVVRLNRAVAVAHADGPHAGLRLLEGLDAHLADHHRLWAVRADLAAKSGDVVAAAASYERAIDLCRNDVELRYLRERLAGLDLA